METQSLIKMVSFTRKAPINKDIKGGIYVEVDAINMNKKRYEVYYENIIDWLPGFNEIRILDDTRENNKYIRVNIAILKPEILLRNILEQTEKGKFAIVSDFNQEDPLRKNEIINFLASNNYRYLVEDLIEE